MKNLLYILIIVVVGIFFHALTLRGVPGNPDMRAVQKLTRTGSPFESSHERSPYALLMSLVDDHSFALSPGWAEVAAPDVGYLDGKFYSFFPPGVPLLIEPLYLLGSKYGWGQLAAYATIPIFNIGGMVLLFLIARQILKLPNWAALLAALIYAFASPAWSYSVTIYQHAISVFLMLAGFWSVYKYSQQGRFSWMWAASVWLGYALAIFVDYPNVILLVPNIVYLMLVAGNVHATKEKIKLNFRASVVVTALVFMVLSGVHAYYNYVNYGSWRTLSNTLVRYEGAAKSAAVLETTKEEQSEIMAHKEGVSSLFKEERLPHGLYVLLFAPDKGLFVYAPIFILAIWGMWLVINGGMGLAAGTLMGLAGINLFVYASFGDPWGGWAFGPRYLIPSMAILALFSAKWIAEYRRKIYYLLAAFLLLFYSCVVALLGVLTTNAVPPKVEADYWKVKYGLEASRVFFSQSITGNFVFNQWLRGRYSLGEYYAVILSLVLLVMGVVLFIGPMFEQRPKTLKNRGK